MANIDKEKQKELDQLVKAALADGIIDGREMKTLLAKAEDLGMDPDTFEIIVEAKRIKIENRKALFKKIIKRWPFIVGGLVILIIALLISNYRSKAAKEREEEIAANGCENFEDCLAKYQFDGCYYYMNKEYDSKSEDAKKSWQFLTGEETEQQSMLKRLISSQISYWAREKQFEKAHNILQELVIQAKYNLNTSNEKENIPYNEEVTFYNNLLEDIINKMLLEKEPKDKILLYCKSFKAIAVGNENDKKFFGGYDSYVLSNEPYKNALVKINEEK